MSSNPIDPEFLHLAREWAGSAMSPENLRPIPGGAIAAARIILDLPEPAPLTMDKITWSDAEHHLAEADAGPHGNVVMLEPYRSKYGRFIRLLMPDSPHQNKVDGMAASGLTPTGRKMKLVPAGWEGVNGPFPDRQPGTTEPVEDAVVEPRVLRTELDYGNAPVGTLARSTRTNTWEKSAVNEWRGVGTTGVLDDLDMHGIARTVLYMPGGGA